MKNTSNSTKVFLLTCLLFSFVAYMACSKSDSAVNTKQLTPYAKITSGDSIVIDTSIVRTDTVVVHDTATLDSVCIKKDLSGPTFQVYAKFSGLAPGYVWVQMGSVWYGPIPQAAAFIPNTYMYESAWFDHISFSTPKCPYLKFTYTTNFYSSPSITRYACACH